MILGRAAHFSQNDLSNIKGDSQAHPIPSKQTDLVCQSHIKGQHIPSAEELIAAAFPESLE